MLFTGLLISKLTAFQDNKGQENFVTVVKFS